MLCAYSVRVFFISSKGIFSYLRSNRMFLQQYSQFFFSAFQHELSLNSLDLSPSTTESISQKMIKVFTALTFCLDELGVWLALKVLISIPGFFLSVPGNEK